MKATFEKKVTSLKRVIFVRENHSKRTFTIKTESGKYRTIKMSKDEFNSSLHNTGNDWQHFLNSSSDYYKL